MQVDAIASTSDAVFAVMLIVNPIAIQVHVTGTLAWALLGSFLMNSGHVWTRLYTLRDLAITLLECAFN